MSVFPTNVEILIKEWQRNHLPPSKHQCTVISSLVCSWLEQSAPTRKHSLSAFLILTIALFLPMNPNSVTTIGRSTLTHQLVLASSLVSLRTLTHSYWQQYKALKCFNKQALQKLTFVTKLQTNSETIFKKRKGCDCFWTTVYMLTQRSWYNLIFMRLYQAICIKLFSCDRNL